MNSLVLNNGATMPQILMGTWPLNGLRLALLVRAAARLGYRGFDLASAYGNEKWFGRARWFCGEKRENLFITTKLSNSEQRRGDISAALRQSLARLGLARVDLYLMHWPVPDLFLSSWKQMESLHHEGLATTIGVCNCHRHHLDALLEVADIVPAVNQIELHPLLSQPDLTQFCRENGIQIEAYSPFARMHPRLVRNEALLTIANSHQKTVPQVILRWNLQHCVAAIPKASSSIRLKENFDIGDFALTEDEMREIDRLNVNFRVRHDPDHCDFSKL